MEIVTARFLEEIRKSHRSYSYVEVTSPKQETFQLTVISGDVQIDRTAAVRRRCTVSCIDPLGVLVPATVESVLTPYGTEIRPYRGVQYSDGTVEAVQLGVFRLAKVSISDKIGGSPEISLEAYDRSREIARDKFTSPYVIAEGANIIDAIKAILARTFPDLEYDAMSSTLAMTAPSLYDVGDDPWDAVTDLATSAGCEIFFNALGRCVIAPPVDIDSLPSPDFTFIEGQGCTMLDIDRVFTDEPGFNGVVVTGASPGDELPPVRAVIWDEEPTSATYHLGPYGEVPMFVTDQVVKTVEDATAMAGALLAAQLGFSSQVSLDATVNPALDAGDVVEVVRDRILVTGFYVIDALRVPLNASGTQSVTLRQKRQLVPDTTVPEPPPIPPVDPPPDAPPPDDDGHSTDRKWRERHHRHRRWH